MLNPKYLVIGCAADETVIHEETKRPRIDVGGVAGQMAAALARHGCDTTLITSVGKDRCGAQVCAILSNLGAKIVATPRGRTGETIVTTRGGEPVKAHGSWPSVSSLSCSPEYYMHDVDCVLLDCTVAPTVALDIVVAAQQAAVPVVINATTRSKSQLILRMVDYPKQLITMNQIEYNQLAFMAKAATADDFCERMGTQNALVTAGSEGWNLYGSYGGHIRSAGITPPINTDFVGCGDYATAGAAHAMMINAPIIQVINKFIKTRMEISAEA